MISETKNRIPVHIAMIMDGNGRWAEMRGKPRLEGHKAGAETVRKVLNYCRDAGVRYLTLYAFSTENWSRPAEEVNGLMKLLSSFIRRHKKELIDNKVRLRVIGRRSDLPAFVSGPLAEVENETSGFDRQLLVALSYSGRSELVDAAREIARAVASGEISPDDVDENTVAANLYAPDVPDPDLIIRTSGEMRISNFLLWQCAYSEFYITDVLWPDFRKDQFESALQAYALRGRRYGGVVNC
ncbi:MAG: isoprenyl transferase [Kiritimatiellia bacterium]